MWPRRFACALLAVAAAAGAVAAISATASRGKHLPRTSVRSCAGHRATIRGSIGSDVIRGTRGRDVIVGGDGNDKILGRGGADIICGGGGRDRIDGGAGNDTVAGGPGRDSLAGGKGKDALGGGHGDDRIAGGAGADRDYGGPGNDEIDPGAGADEIFGGEGADRISAGAGSSTITPDPVNGKSDPGDPADASGGDVVLPNATTEQLLGGDASTSDHLPQAEWRDFVDPGAGDDHVLGSPADDTVVGSPGNDEVDGGDGNDSLSGGDGNDTVDGGDGADTVHGDSGDDVEIGGNGDDTLAAGDGSDRVDGGAGADGVDGGAGRDTILGGPGPDHISAGPGDDTASGGDDRDEIDGGPGADALDGDAGGDSLVGGPDDGSDGPDQLRGGASVDDLHGGGGPDTLDGGADTDAVFGGSGDDTIEAAAGYDTAYGDAGTDVCRDSEQHFLCEQSPGTDDAGRLHDAPPGTQGPCDAWAAPGGDDANPGDQARPYRTVERLANALSAGQTGCLEPGATFEEPDFEVHVRGGGEPGSPIVLRTAPAGPRALVKGRVWIDEAAHDIRFEDLNFDGQNPLATLRGAGAALPSPTVDGDRIEFFGDDVTTSHTATCFVVGSALGFGIAEDVRIAGTRVHDCGVSSPDQPSGDHGIDLEGSRRAVVQDNYIFDNADKGILFFPDAQNSMVRDNVLDANRIAVHFGTAGDNPGQIPNNNAVTNNVITNSRLGLIDPNHWQVEGNKDGAADPVGNNVDGNCFYHVDPTRNIQTPPIAFTAGSNTVAPVGPGYADAAGKDFRLNGGAGECARSFGPEDPPVVTTSPYVDGFDITDRSRSSGSTAWLEARSRTGVWRSTPIRVEPGETRSERVSPPPEFLDADIPVRAVARSASGFAYGAVVFGPGQQVLGRRNGCAKNSGPSLGRTATLCGTSGHARLAGVDHFHQFEEQVDVPLGTEVDASRSGLLELLTMGRDRALDTIHVGGGRFIVRQSKGPRDVTLELSKRPACGRGGRLRASASRSNSLYARWRHRRRRHLTVRGHYASGSARGTTFRVTDLCRGTLVTVQDGVVLVRDFAKHRRVTVKTGHKYLAKAPRRRG